MSQAKRATLVRAVSLDVESLEQRTLLSAVLRPYSFFGSGDRSGITQGPDGAMWLIDADADRIRQVTSDGAVREFTFPGEGDQLLDLGNDIAAGADGKLWFGARDSTGWRMARISTDGAFEFASDAESGTIEQVEAGPDGAIWFARGGGTIARIDAAGQVTPFHVDNLNSVFDLEAGPDGNMWYTGYGRIPVPGDDGIQPSYVAARDHIGKISPGGAVQQFAVTDYKSLSDIVSAPDGFLYVGTYNAIGRVSTEGVVTWIELANLDPVDLTAGPDGKVWFVNLANPLNPLTRLNADGSLDRFAAKNPHHQVNAMTTGTDGKLWYTTGAENAVRKLNPGSGFGARSVRLNVEHKREFTDVVGSFVDFGDEGDAADYEAGIDWGDGQTTPGRITRNDAGGFDVTGTGTLKFGWNTLRITITDKRGAGRDFTFQSMAYAVPTAIAGKGRTIEPTAGQTFSGTLATYIGVDTAELSRYRAHVNWGDGGWSEARLVVGANDVVKVVGTHTYLRRGQYDIHVTVEDTQPDPGVALPPRFYFGEIGWGAIDPPGYRVYRPASPFNDARSRAVVKAGIVDGDAVSVDVTVGQRFNVVVAEFETTEGDAAIDHYRAEIDLGGGGGGDPLEGVIVATGDGRFAVKLAHVLTQERGYSFTVRIYDERRSDDFGPIGVVVGDLESRLHLRVNTGTIAATAGVPFDGKVGTLRSVGSGSDWESEFEVLVHWGDGTTSPGRLVAAGDGHYDVHGTHTYDVVGYHRDVVLAIQVTETRRAIDPGLPAGPFEYGVTDHANWSEESHVAPGSFDGFHLAEHRWQTHVVPGQSSEIFVAEMTPGDPSVPIESYQGVVKWDDGTESAVRFQRSDEYDDVYRVYTTHAFATGGARTGVATITGAGHERSVEVRVYVAEPSPPPKAPVAHVTANDMAVVDDVEFSGIVGAFLPRDPGALPGDFTVTIRWGDGVTTTAVLEARGDGWITVRGTHTYRLRQDNVAEGSEWFVITVRKGDETAAEAGDVKIHRNPARLYADGRPMHFRQREEFTSKVATITSPDKEAVPEDFEAWIEWGDGTRTPGVVTRGHRDTFEVAGTHTYHRSGYVVVSVTVTGPGGTDVATSSMYLDPDPVAVTPTKPTVEGLKIGGRVATFIDEEGKSTDLDTYRVFHAALIDWGDGQISFGTIAELPDGSYEVIGSHTYEKAGEYTVSLVVRRNTRYLPQLPRWYRYRSRGLEWAVAAGERSDGDSVSNGKKDEYAKTLFTVRVKKPKKVTPPKCRPGQKPKRDNCQVVKKKKKKSDKKKSNPTAQRATSATLDVLSLFSSRRIEIEADARSLF